MASKKQKKNRIGIILIVEDVYMVRRTVHLMLESAGHKVIEAPDAQKAMDFIKSGQVPDLIILDIAMPGMDGLDFLRVLRAYKDTKTTPIMMCTARGEEDTIKKARQNGATDFMVKPVNRDTIVAKVKQILEEHPPASARLAEAAEAAEKIALEDEDAPSQNEKPEAKKKKKKAKKKETKN
ncbi:MAG: response regulator [Planctomycetota bacterium]|nr:response regulator [Planctomycetota bacterium]